MHPLILLILLSIGTHASAIIGDVPFVKQNTQFCGPAALSSVMSFYGMEIDQQEIAKPVYSQALHGSIITDMANYARNKGFHTLLDCGTDEKIKDYINEQKPVIVLVDTGKLMLSEPHYLVIVGYNEKGFIAHNGNEASKIYEYETFNEIWEKIGSTYLLIYR